MAINFGSGTYGACQYSTCSISIGSSVNLSLNVTPTSGGVCTTQSDSVSVLTDDPNGYTLTLANSSTNQALTNGLTATINSTTATQSSPASRQSIIGATGLTASAVSGPVRHRPSPMPASTRSSLPKYRPVTLRPMSWLTPMLPPIRRSARQSGTGSVPIPTNPAAPIPARLPIRLSPINFDNRGLFGLSL